MYEIEISIASLILMILGLSVQYFKGILVLSNRINALEIKTDLFWNAVQKEVVDMLKHPHTVDTDALLDKFNKNDLSLEEAICLKKHMEDRLIEKKGTAEGIAAALIIGRLEQLIYDKKFEDGNRYARR